MMKKKCSVEVKENRQININEYYFLEKYKKRYNPFN